MLNWYMEYHIYRKLSCSWCVWGIGIVAMLGGNGRGVSHGGWE